jgi:hypothetical protein
MRGNPDGFLSSAGRCGLARFFGRFAQSAPVFALDRTDLCKPAR